MTSTTAPATFLPSPRMHDGGIAAQLRQVTSGSDRHRRYQRLGRRGVPRAPSGRGDDPAEPVRRVGRSAAGPARRSGACQPGLGAGRGARPVRTRPARAVPAPTRAGRARSAGLRDLPEAHRPAEPGDRAAAVRPARRPGLDRRRGRGPRAQRDARLPPRARRQTRAGRGGRWPGAWWAVPRCCWSTTSRPRSRGRTSRR